MMPGAVTAVVSRGGRPDLAIPRLPEVTCPALLIVGGLDHQVIDMNREALKYLQKGRLVIVPGATHLFEESGTLDQVTHPSTWLASVGLLLLAVHSWRRSPVPGAYRGAVRQLPPLLLSTVALLQIINLTVLPLFTHISGLQPCTRLVQQTPWHCGAGASARGACAVMTEAAVILEERPSMANSCDTDVVSRFRAIEGAFSGTANET